MSTKAYCDRCGCEHELSDLDAKPSETVWLTIIRLVRGQEFMLQYAADCGHDFDRLECKECYGEGYVAL